MTFGDYENSVVLYDAGNQQWLFFHHPLQVYQTHSLPSIIPLLRTIEQQIESNHLYAAGFISYEAGAAFDPAFALQSPKGFPLLWFGIYQKPEQIPLPSSAAAGPLPWSPSISQEEYQSCFRDIKDYIRAGDTYQINYTFRLRAPFASDPWGLFVRMIQAQGYGYGAYVNTGKWGICSASPELFFTLEDGILTSRPMKGTIARGLTQTEDVDQAGRLKRSEKDKAENLMIVDMVRNDMGRLADSAGISVPRLFNIEKYPTLWQMTSLVRCRTQANVTDIFQALFPAASITGVPKVRATHIIAELENTPRRIYTGSIGFLSPGRKAQFNVAIRTVLVDKVNNTAEYGVGGGIVWDSEKKDEWEECCTKAKILTQPVSDFALLETLLWTPKDGYFLLEQHLERLATSAAFFAYPVDTGTIKKQLTIVADQLPSLPHKIRITLSRTEGATVEGHLLLSPTRPYRVRLCKNPVNAQNPFLYHKTTNRSIYEHAMGETPGYDDIVLWNEKKEITESCIANIVVEINERLLTPPVQSGLLPGTYRTLLLEQKMISEKKLFLQDLPFCSKIYLINSVRGMWEVQLEQPPENT